MERRLRVGLRVYCEPTEEAPIGDVTSASVTGVVGRLGMTMSLCMGVSVDCADRLCISMSVKASLIPVVVWESWLG